MGKIGPIGIPELLIILLVVLLIFGPRRLPDMAKGLGQSVREFRKGLRDMRKDFEDEASADDSKPANAAAPVQAAAAPASAQAQSAPSTGTGTGASRTDAAVQGTDSQTEQ